MKAIALIALAATSYCYWHMLKVAPSPMLATLALGVLALCGLFFVYFAHPFTQRILKFIFK